MQKLKYEPLNVVYDMRGVIFGNGGHFIATLLEKSNGLVLLYDDLMGECRTLPAQHAAASIEWVIDHKRGYVPSAVFYARTADADEGLGKTSICRMVFDIETVQNLRNQAHPNDVTVIDSSEPSDEEITGITDAAEKALRPSTETTDRQSETGHTPIRREAVAKLRREWKRRQARHDAALTVFRPGDCVFILMTEAMEKRRRTKFGPRKYPAVVIKQCLRNKDQKELDLYVLVTDQGVVDEPLPSSHLERITEVQTLQSTARVWEQYQQQQRLREAEVSLRKLNQLPIASAINAPQKDHNGDGGGSHAQQRGARVTCNCRQKCEDNRCPCRRIGQPCNAQCHKGKSCSNVEPT
jgi:hypothetical protein